MIPIMRKFKLSVIALAVSSALFAAQPAQAQCCGEATAAASGIVAPAVAAAAASIVTAIATAATALAFVVNEGFGGVVSAIEGSMKIQSFANADIANQQKNLILMGMAASDKLKIASEQSISTLPAANTTGQAAMVAGKGIEGASIVNSYANIELAKRQLINTAGTTNVLNAYQNYLKNYGESGSMPNADILANSLLAGASTKGNVESYTFTPAQLKAAQDYIANAADVSPPSDIPDAAKNTVEGRRYAMMLRAEKARMSLSFKSLADALAYRTPVDGLTGDGLGITKSGNISYQEFLVNEVRRRYNNPQWYGQVAGASPANLQREALFMQALDLHLRMEDSKRFEKMELLLAQLNLSMIASNPLRQQIEQQRSRVLSSGAK